MWDIYEQIVFETLEFVTAKQGCLDMAVPLDQITPAEELGIDESRCPQAKRRYL